MDYAKDVKVEMFFLPTEAGGRKGAVHNGYRPQFYFDGHDWDAVHTYIDVETVQPGEDVSAYLSFISPHLLLPKVKVGRPFLIREGAKTVAFGTITEIIDLEKSARRIAEKVG